MFDVFISSFGEPHASNKNKNRNFPTKLYTHFELRYTTKLISERRKTIQRERGRVGVWIHPNVDACSVDTSLSLSLSLSLYNEICRLLYSSGEGNIRFRVGWGWIG
jgi:hypothetical protein